MLQVTANIYLDDGIYYGPNCTGIAVYVAFSLYSQMGDAVGSKKKEISRSVSVEKV